MDSPAQSGPVALIRHTRADVANGICYGRTDVPLLPDPDATAAILQMLAAVRPVRIWSSPARRCRILAETVADALAIPVALDERLRELDFGAWEGREWSAIPRADLDRWAADPVAFAPPSGESGAALIARVAAFHREVSGGAAPLAIVSHGGPLRVMRALFRNEPVDLLQPALPPGGCELIARTRER